MASQNLYSGAPSKSGKLFKLTADLLSKLLVASVLRLLLYLVYTLKMPEEGFEPEEKTEPIL